MIVIFEMGFEYFFVVVFIRIGGACVVYCVCVYGIGEGGWVVQGLVFRKALFQAVQLILYFKISHLNACKGFHSVIYVHMYVYRVGSGGACAGFRCMREYNIYRAHTHTHIYINTHTYCS